MVTWYRVGILTAAVASAAWAVDAAVVATVDGQPAVTWADVVYQLTYGGEGPAAPPTEAEVRALVDDLVTARVVVMEAEAAGYGADEDLDRRCADYKLGLVLRRMTEMLESETPVTEEDIRAFYEKDRKWRKYAAFHAKNKEAAATARAALEAGAPWPEIVAAYATWGVDRINDGACDTPMGYDATPMADTVYATPVGGYTPPLPDENGIRWAIYRIDAIVHGRTDTLAEAAPGIRRMIAGARGWLRRADVVAALRAAGTVVRTPGVEEDVRRLPYADFARKWGGAAVVSRAGDVDIRGEEILFAFADFYALSDEGMDEERTENAADFAYVTGILFARVENDALMEYEARRRGLDKDESVVRAARAFYEKAVADKFAMQEFVAKLPPITDEDCERYFAAHADRFVRPEWVELYAFVFPDRTKLEGLYARIQAGEDVVDVGETYNRAVGRALMYGAEAPAPVKPEEEEWLGVVKVLAQPSADSPDGRFAAELRSRAFRWREPKKLSEIFQLPDGRWAFYAPLSSGAEERGTLADPAWKGRCQRWAWDEYFGGPVAEQASREWLAGLRAKHRITVDDAVIATGLRVWGKTP